MPFWKYPLKITPLEQKIVPIPANSPSEISPSQLQISLPGGYLILHWPHIDPQQKSPSQTVPSEKVYFPHPLNCPSFVFPSYVSPFEKVRVDCPSILSSLNSHFRVKTDDLQTPSPCLLPLLNWPSYVSPFSKVYFPFPANLFLRKVPSSLTEVIDWGVALFYLEEIVKIPSRLFSSAKFPSKCLRVSPF